MRTLNIVMLVILGVFLVWHFIHAYRFLRRYPFKTYFSTRLIRLHKIMIWIVPFIWAGFLSASIETVKGSYEFEDKSDPQENDGHYSGA